MEAIRIIVNEHRALAAVLHGMLYLVHEIRDHDEKPDFNLFGAMIYYIDSFPERFHHPKEDQYLYRVRGEFVVKRPSVCERSHDNAGATHIYRVRRG